MRKSMPGATCLVALLTTCSGANDAASSGLAVPDVPFLITAVAQFDQPWALSFLPDGRALVTEQPGALKLLDREGRIHDVSGVPAVDYGGQGGLGDVVVHPAFADNALVFLSYAEAGGGDTRGAAVARGTLKLDTDGGASLSGVEVIWRQVPKVTGRGHYGHRIAFGPDGHLWITSGERQQFDPAQDMHSNLGKIVRLEADGSVPADNPFASAGGVTAQIWSLGHRNPLGIAFDADGRLWVHEMGPKGGDELNLVERGANYGYPIVSEGDHYDGRTIPDHDNQPQLRAPVLSWTPVIAPAGFIIYSGNRFPQWQGDGFIGGLAGKALVRIEFSGITAREAERYDLGQRIREVEQDPNGDIWLLEDGQGGSGGRLLKLSPAP